MNEPGYPDQETLDTIEKWPYTDLKGWFDYIIENWPWNPDWCVKKTQRRIYISTGGWSGCEDLISAMQNNTLLWSFSWMSSRRGGHFEFKIPKIQKSKKVMNESG